MKKLITKKDFILLAIVLIVGIGGFFLLNSDDKGEIAIIKVNGEPLAEMKIEDEYHEATFNCVTVCCENKEIYVKDSTCPDKVCVRSGRISKAGECIICAPNRVAIEISGKNENQLDALTG